MKVDSSSCNIWAPIKIRKCYYTSFTHTTRAHYSYMMPPNDAMHIKPQMPSNKVVERMRVTCLNLGCSLAYFQAQMIVGKYSKLNTINSIACCRGLKNHLLFINHRERWDRYHLRLIKITCNTLPSIYFRDNKRYFGIIKLPWANILKERA